MTTETITPRKDISAGPGLIVTPGEPKTFRIADDRWPELPKAVAFHVPKMSLRKSAKVERDKDTGEQAVIVKLDESETCHPFGRAPYEIVAGVGGKSRVILHGAVFCK